MVIDDDVPYDPSDLKGLVRVPRSALKKRLMRKVERVLWVRAADTQGGDLHGYAPTDCRTAHGVQLCLVVATTPKRWRTKIRPSPVIFPTSFGMEWKMA